MNTRYPTLSSGRLQRWAAASWPVCVIVTLAIAFFWRFFVLGYVPAPGEELTAQYPWAGISAPGKPHYGSLGDVVELNYPWKRFTISRFRAGEFPLWNPHVFGGNTHLANFQSPALTPFNVLYAIFPFHTAYSLSLALQLGVSGITMLAFLRTLGVGAAGAAMGAVVFMFNGHFMQWFELEAITGVALWLPLIWLATERILAGGPWPWALAGAGALGAQFLAGHLQFASFNVLLLACYVGVRAPTHLKRDPRPLARTIWLLLVMTVAGILLGAAQILPSLEALHWNGARWVRAFDNYTFSVPQVAASLVTILSPYALGDLMSGAFVGHREYIVYFGMVPLALAAGALVLARSPAARAFGILALAIATLSLTPTYWLLYKVIPGYNKTVDPFRLARYTLPVVGSVLAGLGLDAIISPSTDRRRLIQTARLLGGGATALAALYLVGLWAEHYFRPAIVAAGHRYVETRVWNQPQHLGPLDYYYAKVDAMYAELVSNFMPWRPSVWLPALSLAATVLAVVWRARGQKRVDWITAGAIGLTLVELIPIGLRYNPFVPPDRLYPSAPAIEFLRALPGPFRLLSLDTLAHLNVQKVLTGAIPTVFGLNTITGYDSIIPRWMYEYLVAATLTPEQWQEHPFTNRPRLSSPTSPLLPLLSVRYVVTTRHLDAPFLTLVYNGEVRIYEDRRARPRAWVATGAEVARDPGQTLKRLTDPTFDSTAVVLLAGEAPGAAPPEAIRPVTGAPGPPGSARLLSDEPLRVEIETTAGPHGGYLVLTDTYFPGWRAYVDGAETPIYRANHTVRAVSIGPGPHRVTFTYWPKLFWVGLVLSLGTLGGLSAAATFSIWRRWALHRSGDRPILRR